MDCESSDFERYRMLDLGNPLTRVIKYKLFSLDVLQLGLVPYAMC